MRAAGAIRESDGFQYRDRPIPYVRADGQLVLFENLVSISAEVLIFSPVGLLSIAPRGRIAYRGRTAFSSHPINAESGQMLMERAGFLGRV